MRLPGTTNRINEVPGGPLPDGEARFLQANQGLNSGGFPSPNARDCGWLRGPGLRRAFVPLRRSSPGRPSQEIPIPVAYTGPTALRSGYLEGIDMVRRLGFSFVFMLATAFIVAACGRQVTPNPPGLGAGGAPPGYIAVFYSVESPFNFSNYQYLSLIHI